MDRISLISNFQFASYFIRFTEVFKIKRNKSLYVFNGKKSEVVMGKYFLAWLLGVPLGLLIIIYIIFHVF